jgi:putative ABC transport system permease protein
VWYFAKLARQPDATGATVEGAIRKSAMDLESIVSSLWRNRTGALLIGLQIALTLAIVCNSLSIIQQRVQRAQRPTGLDEGGIFVLDNTWLDQDKDQAARTQDDLAALRSLPGVIDAVATDALPLRTGRENGWIALQPDQKRPSGWAGYYTLDDHGLAAFGMRVSAGRWFSSEEINFISSKEQRLPPVAVVSAALARTLFPGEDALGKEIYYVNNFPMRIVGIVDTLEAAVEPLSLNEPFAENSLIVPGHVSATHVTYVVRTRPGQRDAIMRVAANKLLSVSRARLIDHLEPFESVRAKAYHGARALSLILGSVSTLLLLVTGLGIVGLTSYWVGQKRRQIGVRRALGACRADILAYFHTENLLIAGSGAVLGITLAIILNLSLASGLQVAPLGARYTLLGALIVFALSQAAVLWPAMRAASISPAIAARGA